MATSTRKSSTSTSKSKTSSPAASPTPAAAAPEAAAPAADPAVVEPTEPAVLPTDLRKKQLIELVTERSGIKRKDAKPVVEAMLAVLGETLAEGRELNLQPLGKLRINRTVEKGNGRIIVCRLRQSLSAAADPADPEGTAPGGEDA